MSDIGKGDWLQATRDFLMVPIKTGDVICVDGFVELPGACPLCDHDGPALVLVGFPRFILIEGDSESIGFCPCGFKPLRKPPEDYLAGMRKKIAETSDIIVALAEEIYRP